MNRINVLKYHKTQSELWLSNARFNIVYAGRRSGKTEIIGKRKLVKKAILGENNFGDWKGFAGAPTRDQAKRIYWDDLKSIVPKNLLVKRPSESKLSLSLYNRNGTISEICVLGMDRPERVEGTPWDYGVLDEFGNMKPETWTNHVRPALSDRKGGCDFIGVPEGRNHYYNLVKDAEASTLVDLKGNKVWRTFHWLSEEILDADEIIQAKEDLDDLTYEQEYCGSFVIYSGLAYYKFNSKAHIANCKSFYDKKAPLIFCFDFNVAPGTATVLQEMDEFPNGKKPESESNLTCTSVIGEVHIKRNSNTEKVCDKLVEDWGAHEGLVFVYGDATGGAGGSAKVKGSDWDLVKQRLYPHFGNRLVFKVRKNNPRERARINSVNSRLMTMIGDVHFQVDPSCINVIKDFEGVKILDGSVGEIDKKADPMLSHLTDGVGYYVHQEFPIVRMVATKETYWK